MDVSKKKWKPRFTLGRMMAVVAILALLLGAFEAGRRWERESGTPFVGVTQVSVRYLDDDVIYIPPTTEQETP
ncbi:MAG: hypothetical protein U0800_00500 [Isosphaeraceae bacterium]